MSSYLTNTTFYEIINKDTLDALYYEAKNKVAEEDFLNQSRLKNSQIDHELASLKRVRETIVLKDDNYVIPVNYVFSKNTPGLGRIYPLNSTALITMKRDTRIKLAGEYYYDIDIVNCHPSILIHYAKMIGLPCENLCSYVNNREEWLAKNKISRELSKELYLRMIFTGKVRSFCLDRDVDINNIHKDVFKFENELRNLSTKLMESPELRFFYTKVKNSGRSNVIASSLSLFLQDTERMILELIVNEYKKLYPDGYKYLSLQYDGIMIRKDYFDKEMLLKIEAKILEVYGINIRLTIKQHDTDSICKKIKETIKNYEKPILIGIGAALSVAIRSFFN